MIDMAKKYTQEEMQEIMRKEYNERTKAMNKAMMDARPRGTPELDEYRQMLADDFAAEEREAKKIKSSDIKKVSSFAKAAAKNAKSEKAKQISKDIVKNTPVTKSLLSVVAKGAGLIGSAAAMAEFRKVHNAIKKKGSGRFGSKTLLEILK